ncbi:hypothetical protein PHYBOEH_007577 [Phytophthora boehmeriae]|uniref:Necrosis inducing-like protein NPP1 type n=1 Tax=Phytophthora boehmeriae TaxID=109152 RepID=A0A8T1WA97_9STRA|nr:hypothetical protein PHYBOEH_007577 [Phytophthora boehmeriae]
MNFRGVFALIIACVCAVQADSISHDEVKVIYQTEAKTISEIAAVRFKPQLRIGSGCHSYPAVNAEGQTSGGLAPSGSSSSGCRGFFVTSQVYVRSAWFNDVWGIMYAWYFPKDSSGSGEGHRHDWENIVVWIDNPALDGDATILAISTSNTDGYRKYTALDELVAGNAALVLYDTFDSDDHTLSLNKHGGDLQELILWSQLPDVARKALNETSFDPAVVPMKDETFMANLEKAWPTELQK